MTLDDSPLEWWEELQVRFIEMSGQPDLAAHFRKHPSEWRELREEIRASLKAERAAAAKKEP